MGSELRRADGYRVGDAERNRAADLLKEAHAAGYLTLEEVDERLGAALAARTRGELDRLVADLPPEWRATQQGTRRPARRPGFAEEAAWLAPLALVALAVVALALVMVTRGGGFFFFPFPLLWILFAFGRRARWGPPRW
jgi:uncharacterized protein DUF1707